MANPIHQVTITGRAIFDTAQAKEGLADLKGQAGGVRSAVEQVTLEKAAQGGWGVGNTDNIIESLLELLVHLLGSQA